MKQKCLNLLILLALISSCNNKQVATTKKEPILITKGEECSIKFSGIEFTKSLNGALNLTTIEDAALVLKCNAKSDNFNDPDGKLSNNTAPVLLTKIDNTKPFTFTTKVTPTFKDVYDAGTMYLYLNPKLWLKFAFERDERMKTRIVTVRTNETSDDNNHDVIAQNSVYLKISSDAKTIGFYYSLDNITWQLVRLFKNEYPSELWTGLSTQSPLGNGTQVAFENCTFTKTSIKDFRMGI